jgi:hypothetical protein
MTSERDRRLVTLRHRGVAWTECARQLEQRVDALRRQATRLRDAGQWTLADGRPARGAPQPGKYGRPRRPPYKVVSVRFDPAVADALRGIAAAAKVSLSRVVETALERHLRRRVGGRVSKSPLGLAPGEPVALVVGPKTTKFGVTISRELLAALDEARPSTAIASAVEALLRDLHYQW